MPTPNPSRKREGSETCRAAGEASRSGVGLKHSERTHDLLHGSAILIADRQRHFARLPVDLHRPEIRLTHQRGNSVWVGLTRICGFCPHAHRAVERTSGEFDEFFSHPLAFVKPGGMAIP